MGVAGRSGEQVFGLGVVEEDGREVGEGRRLDGDGSGGDDYTALSKPFSLSSLSSSIK